MSVRDADGVDPLDLEALRVRRISVGPGIHQDHLARRKLELKSPMAQPGNAHAYSFSQVARMDTDTHNQCLSVFIRSIRDLPLQSL